MTKKKVFITRDILPDGLELLKSQGFEVEVNSEDRPLLYAELMEKAKKSDALITMLSDKIDQNFLEANSHLKVISNYAVGFNNIDLKTANRLTIAIGNTPDVLTEATAEIALGLMIAASRNFKEAANSAKDGRWTQFEPRGHLGHALRGKSLGIVGMGRIGLRLAEMAAHAFKMNILYTAHSEKNNSINAKKVSLDSLLQDSDFISLHVPLNPESRNLIGKNEFMQMKKEAVLINTSRGEVIDQDALIWALKEKKIFAAGLDVTTPEPLPLSSELFKLENVFILPHIGSATYEARRAMSIMCAKNIIAGLEGRELESQVK